jgi:hypothetical protein
MHRSLPPWLREAPSGHRPTRASAGSSERTLVPVSGSRSRPRRMARYVVGCRPLHKVHHAPFLEGPIVWACVVHDRHAMLDLTHPGRLPIPIMHRSLPPWCLEAISSRRRTRAPAGRTIPPLVTVAGSIASSSDGMVRVWMLSISQCARCHCPRWWSHRVCMSAEGSACDARSDASLLTTHPIMHRTLPQWCS